MRGTFVLSVYFSGTGHSIEYQNTLASKLYHATQSDNTHGTMSFNGCGVDYRIMGTLFGKGLERQCQFVKQRVIGLLKEGYQVKLNMYGHSRGGIACLLLILMLKDIDPSLLQINSVLMDPVPGNLLITSAIDFLSISLARQVMDVSSSQNLANVLAIYPNVPLPSIAAHAPVIPEYPKTCQVVERITPGCHASAELLSYEYTDVTTYLAKQFLETHGTIFFGINLQISDDKQLVKLYDHDWDRIRTLCPRIPPVFPEDGYQRQCHSKSSVLIVTRPQNASNFKFFNAQHKSLSQKTHEEVIPGNEENMPLVNHPNKDSEVACFFKPERKHYFKEMGKVSNPKQTLSQLTAFVKEVSESVSEQSKKTKGLYFKNLITYLENQPSNENQIDSDSINDIFRNTLALILQRDRYALSLFTTTRSGYKTLDLLKKPDYNLLAEMIPGSGKEDQNGTNEIRYKDLRKFVLGRNDESYFNARHALSHYQNLDTAEKMVKNNIKMYF